MKPTKLTKDQIQNTLKSAIDEAVNFIESEIAPDRIKSQRYFDGKVNIGHEAGRSKVIATKCRDTVRAIKPALMRLFLQSGKPVEFVPNNPQSEIAAQQATEYAKYVFDKNGGFKLLHSAIHDALVKKVGVLKAYYDEQPDAEIDEYSGLTDAELEYLRMDPELTILEEEIEQEAMIGPDGVAVSPAMYSLKVSRETKRGAIKIVAVAPEDFFVDRGATDIVDCYVCGHTTETRVGDVVAMGYDFETVYDLAGTGSGSVDEEEELARNGWDTLDDDESPNDPSMRKITLTEAYMKMDIEGIGVPNLYKFICASDKYEILDYELCDINPFAIYEVDPEPHTFFGRSLVEIITDDQDASTSLLRGLLDNIALVNNPRLEVVDDQVNIDDVLNNEIGALIRVKAPGMMREITVGSVAAAALPAIDYYDQTIRAKTGILGAGMGLDPDAMQNQTATGARMMDQAAAAVADLIARILAEGGQTRLFKIIAQLARQHPDQNAMMRINGQFQPVDPRSWGVDMDMQTNVGLGTNKGEEKAMVLREVLQYQQGIMSQFGPFNPIAGIDKAMNAMSDMLELAGLHNPTRYFGQVTPEMIQQFTAQAQQAAQGQQQASDPNAAFLQAEQMKVSARAQADQQKAQLDYQKALMQDDRERDKMLQDLYIEGAKLAVDTGLRLNTEQIRAQQAATGPMGAQNVQGQ
jgi:hypothetical protein